MSERKNVGIYIFDNMTMLDAYAPLQILSFVESFNTFTFAASNAPLRADCGALLTPDHDLESCPELDILVMPGGGDVLPEMTRPALHDFLHRAAPRAGHITSVCTGALILAEAGLLDGYRATTHWAWRDDLARYPRVTVVDQRVVVDRDRITGGGITAGIDFALTLIGEVVGVAAAQAIELLFEYRPQPPFNTGGPELAPAAIRARVSALAAAQRQGLIAHLDARFAPQ